MLSNYDKIKQGLDELSVKESFDNFAVYDERVREKLENQEFELKQKLYRRQRRRHTDLWNSSFAGFRGSGLFGEVRIGSFLCDSGDKIDGTLNNSGGYA